MKEVWEEDLQIKASSKDDKERHHATCHKKFKYYEGRGQYLKRFCNGWTVNGQDYYQELLGILGDLKSSDVWETLQDHWKLYQKKYYARGDYQDDDLRAPKEECVANDKNDLKIDMPDGDEIDDIGEESIDDSHFLEILRYICYVNG
jgi:hypothetical protein